MFELSTVLIFSGTVIILAITPGPDLALIIGRGFGQGRNIAILTAVGFFLAGLIQIPLLAFGLSSLIQSEPIIFDIIRIAGGGYLIFKGIKLLRSASKYPDNELKKISGFSALQEGFIASLVNPKSHMFLLAFLPQFVDPSRGSVALQFIILGTIMRVVALAVEVTLATMAGTLGLWLAKNPNIRLWQERLTGGLFILIGVRLISLEK